MLINKTKDFKFLKKPEFISGLFYALLSDENVFY